MKIEDCEVGMWVIYEPYPGGPKEDGEVVEIRENFAMVRYDRGSAKATYPSQLEPGVPL